MTEDRNFSSVYLDKMISFLILIMVMAFWPFGTFTNRIALGGEGISILAVVSLAGITWVALGVIERDMVPVLRRRYPWFRGLLVRWFSNQKRSFTTLVVLALAIWGMALHPLLPEYFASMRFSFMEWFGWIVEGTFWLVVVMFSVVTILEGYDLVTGRHWK